MAGVNKVFLMGNLTRDPETRTLPGGQAVCSFGLASNRRWTDRQSGERKEEVSFFDIEAWGRTAELVVRYLQKGRPAFVEGRLKQERWETEEGRKMSKIKVIADNVQFLEMASGGEGAPPAAAASGEGIDWTEEAPF